MIAPNRSLLPRWITALIMFALAFGLLLVSLSSPLVGSLYYYLIILAALVLWIYVDRENPEDLGLQFVPKWWWNLILGIVLGGGIIGIILVIEVLAGWISIEPIFSADQWAQAALILVSYAIGQGIVAFSEELVNRGYIQQNLATTLTFPLAILGSAILFSFLHIPTILRASVPILHVGIFLFNMFLGGVLLGWSFKKTQSLWLPIGIHFGWNFMIFHVFSFGDRGIFNIQNLGPEVITGGITGPEVGLLGTITLLILILLMLVDLV